MVLVPGLYRKKLDAATLDVLAGCERSDSICYFLKSDGPMDDPRLRPSADYASVYLGNSTVEELFLMLSDARIEHVHIGKKYVPPY